MINERIAALADKLAQVEAHCMCAKFEDDGERYRVMYPPGMVLDGAQAQYRNGGKLAALERMLAAMERHWKESGIK